MELAGEVLVGAPPERVREVLLDWRAVGRLWPAVRDLRPTGPGILEGTLVLGNPPLARRHPVCVTLAEQDGELRLAAAGTRPGDGVRVQARCRLRPGAQPGTTRLAYALHAELGPLARWLGPGSAPRLAEEFLAALEAEAVRGG
jgi:carbon monoxide dehydrogenase subunit G